MFVRKSVILALAHGERVAQKDEQKETHKGRQDSFMAKSMPCFAASSAHHCLQIPTAAATCWSCTSSRRCMRTGENKTKAKNETTGWSAARVTPRRRQEYVPSIACAGVPLDTLGRLSLSLTKNRRALHDCFSFSLPEAGLH